MKRALVISGGGSKGAFAVGILLQLRTVYPNLHFDLVVGTSTGALMSPLAAVEALPVLLQIYSTVTTDKVITTHRLGDRLNQASIYTVEPLWQLINTYMTDARYQQILSSGKHIYINTTCLQTGSTTVFTSNPTPVVTGEYPIRSFHDGEHMRLSILASACQPVFMTPVMVDQAYETGPEKNFQYVDGGVREYAGVQMAIDQGATEIFCILLSAATPGNIAQNYATLLPILERTVDIFTDDVEKNDLLQPAQTARTIDYLSAVKKKMLADGIAPDKVDAYFRTATPAPPFNLAQAFKLFILRPSAPLEGGAGGLVFDPVKMRNMMAFGKSAAGEFIAALKPGDISWLA